MEDPANIPPADGNAVPLAMPVFTYRPVPPVASKPAYWVWILALPAMFPLLGILPGLAVGVLSIMLLAGRRPLPHDRRVGLAGLVLTSLSICFAVSAGIGLARATASKTPQSERFRAILEQETDEEPGPADGDRQPAPPSRSPAPARRGISWDDVFFFTALIVSIMLHEIAHALAAFWSGDPTARDQGRFSLNPLRHVDWFGSVILPVLLMLLPGNMVLGWAKPVPIVPLRFRSPRAGRLAVTLAGVSVNLLLALLATNILTALLLSLKSLHPHVTLTGLLLPSSPVQAPGVSNPVFWITAISVCRAFVWVNVILAGFNLLPIPPLDGFGVVQALAPKAFAPLLTLLNRFGFFILFGLIALGFLQHLLLPVAILGMGLVALARWLGGAY